MNLAALAPALWPQITSPPQLVAQRENTVYRVETTLGPHALRLHRPGLHSAAALQSELDWMAMLAAAGFQVPRPQPTVSGDLLAQISGRMASLLTWLPGTPLGATGRPLPLHGPARTATFHALGAQMARLHSLSDRWQPPARFTRPVWDQPGLIGDAPLWGAFWALPDPADAALMQRLRAHAATRLPDAADYGLIHADLVRENVLIDGPHLHFIDFDDSGFGFRGFDIATALLKNLSEPDFPALQTALLAGYQSQRPLPDPGLLPLFLALRSVTYIGWAATRMAEPGTPLRAARFLATSKTLIARHLPELL